MGNIEMIRWEYAGHKRLQNVMVLTIGHSSLESEDYELCAIPLNYANQLNYDTHIIIKNFICFYNRVNIQYRP